MAAKDAPEDLVSMEPQRFVDIFCADNMNYLHDFDGRRCRADFSVGIVRDRVDQLYN